MRIPKNPHELIRQNEKSVKKSQKHDANLQKNTILYFQVGLIICLLAAYGLFEMTFETRLQEICEFKPIEEPALFIDVPLIKPAQPEKEEMVKKQITRVVDPKFVIDENTPEIFTKDPVVTETPIDPKRVPEVIKIPEVENVPYILVEQVPIYPGCERAKDNNERKKCMSDKINKLVQKKFNSNIASEYGLSGIQRINVEFKIDKTGHVTDIKTRATHPKLEEEAERVVNIIPDMEPGKQRDKPVGVIYSLPIVFKVQN
ncbi:energy transducer TonB [Yeosuana marina]|uniref:energy transducer TonB n=1 Tax=Yeosuana marina TaxID=1565536 RepID=UPI0030C866EE